MTVNKIRRNGSYAPLSAHYYKDDAIDEAGLDAELLYVRGLAFCADVLSDGFISDRQLARFVGVGMTDVVARATSLVEVGLWEQVEGGYRVRSWLEWNRSRAEITEYQSKDAARKTRSKPVPPDSDPPDNHPPNGVRTDVRKDSERSPNGIRPRARTPRNSTPLQEKTSPNADASGSHEFDDFWNAYPRRIGKRAAEKAHAAALKRGATAVQLLTAARRFATSKQGTEAQFIPHPATWLNQGRYDDEPDTQLTLVQAGPELRTFDDYRRHAAGEQAARLLRKPYLPEPQPPTDRTHPRQWARDQAIKWIDAHEPAIRAALTHQETA
jgi:hypothetical protein